jgi:hypothetical protein
MRAFRAFLFCFLDLAPRTRSLVFRLVFRARLGLPIGRPTAQPRDLSEADMSHDFSIEGPEPEVPPQVLVQYIEKGVITSP